MKHTTWAVLYTTFVSGAAGTILFRQSDRLSTITLSGVILLGLHASYTLGLLTAHILHLRRDKARRDRHTVPANPEPRERQNAAAGPDPQTPRDADGPYYLCAGEHDETDPPWRSAETLSWYAGHEKKNRKSEIAAGWYCRRCARHDRFHRTKQRLSEYLLNEQRRASHEAERSRDPQHP